MKLVSPADGGPALRLAALSIAAATAIFTFALVAGVTESRVIALMSAVVIGASVGLWQWSRPTVPIDVSGCSRAFLTVSLVAAVLALVFVSRLTVFMIDPGPHGYSTVPSSDFEVRHSCLTAYFVAADVVRRTPNVYDTALYAAPDDDPTKPRKPQMMGIFRVDQYEYPPPFLLAPRALSVVAPGFLRAALVVVRAERPRAARGFARYRACDGAGRQDARAAARASRPRLRSAPSARSRKATCSSSSLQSRSSR